MEWSYKDCAITITTPRNREGFKALVKLIRPHDRHEVMLMIANAFPSAQLAEDFGKQMAREWIDENVK